MPLICDVQISVSYSALYSHRILFFFLCPDLSPWWVKLTDFKALWWKWVLTQITSLRGMFKRPFNVKVKSPCVNCVTYDNTMGQLCRAGQHAVCIGRQRTQLNRSGVRPHFHVISVVKEVVSAPTPKETVVVVIKGIVSHPWEVKLIVFFAENPFAGSIPPS